MENSVVLAEVGSEEIPNAASGVPANNRDELKVLLYACGSTKVVQIGELTPNIASLYNLVVQHRLAYRLLVSITSQERHALHPLTLPALRKQCSCCRTFPKWMTTAFTNALLDHLAYETERSRHQQNTVNSLARTIGTKHRPLLIIKGPAVNYHLARSAIERPSADADIFVDDVAYAWRTLRAAGFQVTAKLRKHEFATFLRDDVCIELHRYWPIWSYSDDFCNWLRHSPTSHYCREEYADGVTETRLVYENLVNDGMSYDLIGNRVAVPNIEMTAIILIAHLMRHYMYSPIKKNLALKLSEIVDFRDLISAEKFDIARFNSYVKRYSLRRALELATTAMRDLFGCVPSTLSYLSLMEWRDLPRKVISDSFTRHGWYRPSSFSDCVYLQDFEEMIGRLPSNEFRIDGTSQAARLVLTTAAQVPQGAFYIASTNALANIGFSLTVRWLHLGLACSAHFSTLSAHHSYYLCFAFPNEVRRWVLLEPSYAGPSLNSNLQQPHVAYSGSSQTITCFLEGRDCGLSAKSRALFVVVKRYLKDIPMDDQQPDTIVVPLRLVRTG